MKLHILGSGSCIPYKKRGSSGHAVILERSNILLDCGNGTTWKLALKDIDYLEIDYIFISHLHPDHTSDLVPFLFGTKYNMEKKRKKPLYIKGPPGFLAFFNSLKNTFNNWIDFEYLHVSEIQAGEYTFDDFVLCCECTPHTESSMAYSLISDGKKLVYTGDTDYSDRLIKFAEKADLLLIECSYPDGNKVKGHLTPSEVKEISRLSEARKVVLTHLYPLCDRIDILSQVGQLDGTEFKLAEDLMEIEI